MQALILVKAAQPEGAVSGTELKSCLSSLQAMGISHHMAVVENMPTDAYVNTHDFVVIPSTQAGFITPIDDTGVTIPFIALGGQAGGAGYGATPGVTTGAKTNYSDDFFTCDWSGDDYVAAFASTYILDDGVAIATCMATAPDVTGGGDQANAGRVAAWSTLRGDTPGGVSRIYVSAFKPANHSMLPFMLQAAINDGLISAPPRKAPMCVDLDHINGQYVTADETILDVIASYVHSANPNGIMWAGIYNANTDYFEDMTATKIAKLQKYSGKPFKYCWHDHTLNPLIGTNLDASGYSTDGANSKANQDDLYTSDEAVWVDHGLTFDEDNFYANWGSNSWDEASLELMSTDVSKMSSAANDTVQTGRGCTAFRGVESANISRPMGQKNNVYINMLHTKKKVRGIQIFQTKDMSNNNDMPYDNIIDWRKNFTYICQALSYCHTMYLHDQDFIAADQSPGTADKQHGYVQMQMLVDIGLYLKNVCVPFDDITKYIPKINYL